MPAYVVGDIEVSDSAAYGNYVKLVGPTVAKFGGKLLAPGLKMKPIEGSWNPSKLVILEFPSMEQAQAWWDSSDYAPAKKVRQDCSTADFVLVAGL